MQQSLFFRKIATIKISYFGYRKIHDSVHEQGTFRSGLSGMRYATFATPT